MPGRTLLAGYSLRRGLRFAALSAVLCLSARCLFAASCSVVKPHPPTEADKALLAADYAKAADLYRADLASHPGDAELTIGLVHALLRQQKVEEAADQVKASLAAAPNSAALMTLRGEVELRQGRRGSPPKLPLTPKSWTPATRASICCWASWNASAQCMLQAANKLKSHIGSTPPTRRFAGSGSAHFR